MTLNTKTSWELLKYVWKLEEENRKLENKIHKLWIRIYQNIDGEKRKEYQEYCKRHRL